MSGYEYRMVTRRTLGELEKAVRKLQLNGWTMQNQDHGPTVAEALDVIAGGGMVTVAMRRGLDDGNYPGVDP